MIREDVLETLKTGDKTVPEIVGILFNGCSDWERPTKIKYVYNALHKAEHWGHVTKTKTSHKTVVWRLVR